jgi:hypothetical protein
MPPSAHTSQLYRGWASRRAEDAGAATRAICHACPIIFGRLYMHTLIGLDLKLFTDLTYMVIDPRIDFATRGA